MARTPRRPLTEEKVRTARRLWMEGWTARELGKLLDANYETLYQAVRGRTWKHVPGICPATGTAILTEEIVRRARNQWRRGTRTADLAERYGVSAGVMEAALRGRTWRRVKGPITGYHHRRGEAASSAKLTRLMVLEARRLYRAGWTFAELGERYCVTSVCILFAVRGKTWKHLPGAVERR